MKSSLTCPLVVCLLLSGCVADGAPVPASGSVEALLEEDVRADLGRVAVRDLGETRLGLDGPLLAARTVPYDWGAVGFSRWGDDGPAPRAQEVDGEIVMVADSPTVRLLLSPDREDLHDVMRHQAGGGATYDGHRGDDGEGVEFAAGGPVEIRGVDEEAGTLLIGVEDRFFDVEAWVDADAVGTIYDPRDVDWEDFRFGDELHLRWDAQILDAPDGAVLATVDPNRELPPDYYGSCFFDGSELLERWGDWARVYVARGGVAVDGWVHEDEVVQQRSGCGGAAAWASAACSPRRRPSCSRARPCSTAPRAASRGPS